MITSCPISTVSYNTVGYITKVLDRLIQEKEITFYAFIQHYAEEDEKKDHIHVYIVPNKRIDTDSLREHFEEPDTVHNKPRVCMPFYSSKWQDWYLYSIHDERYLESKCDSRKYHYKREEFVVSDELYFNEMIHTINYSKFMGTDRFIEAVKSGLSWKELCIKGFVPVGLLGQYERLFHTIRTKDNRDKYNYSLQEMVQYGFTLQQVLEIYELPEGLVPIITEQYNIIRDSFKDTSSGVAKGETLCVPEHPEKVD